MSIHHRPLRISKTPWYRIYKEEITVGLWMLGAYLVGLSIWLSIDRIESWFR